MAAVGVDLARKVVPAVRDSDSAENVDELLKIGRAIDRKQKRSESEIEYAAEVLAEYERSANLGR